MGGKECHTTQTQKSNHKNRRGRGSCLAQSANQPQMKQTRSVEETRCHTRTSSRPLNQDRINTKGDVITDQSRTQATELVTSLWGGTTSKSKHKIRKQTASICNPQDHPSTICEGRRPPCTGCRRKSRSQNPRSRNNRNPESK